MPRYNRTLTQFAVGKLEEFLELGIDRFVPAAAGNTSVAVRQQGDLDLLVFSLFDAEIATLFFDGSRFLGLTLADGGFYDRSGSPSRTTRERLNGLLDAMGEECLIPAGTRVFLAENKTKCFVGRDTLTRPFGRGFDSVTILAHPIQVQFDD